MKTPNIKFPTILLALAFALAPIAHAAPRPEGGPIHVSANQGVSANSEPYSARIQEEQLPVMSVHSTGDVTRGKTGSFVLSMSPALMFGGAYVNFSVSGSAISGVDYVAVVSPAYIGKSGYATILIHTLADPRASSLRQAYSVVVSLQSGLGYSLGEPKSAKMMINP